MKSIFSKILISFFMLGIFLVPVSLNLNTINNHSNFVEISKTHAQNTTEESDGFFLGALKSFASWILYDLFFVPLAALAKLCGFVLDFFIKYSIQSDSYRSTFVEAAWGTVRDVANIFFLLGLLYVAIQIVLDIHVSEKKKMIGNIIVMALLVNFSLFATQVVIDASNIVSRIFYSQIKSIDGNGVELKENDKKPKSISASIVGTFDPQTILGKKNSASTSFIFTTMIMIFVVGYLSYMFLSLSFLFVGRIVSLWIAMIFGPIAFMSRALGMTALEDLSWKNWLDNLIKAAMMAPIFLFFLYIVLLLGKWLGTLKETIAKSAPGDSFFTIIGVLIPMFMVFTLLMKAKSLAVKYSGDIGQGVAKFGNIATVTGAALATGGLALAGRQVIGRTIATASREETLSQRVANGNTNGLNRIQIALGKAGNKIGATGIFNAIGNKVNKTQKKLKEIDHAKQEFTDLKKEAHLEDVANWQMSAIDKKKLEDTFAKKKKGDFENMVRKGFDGAKTIDILDPNTGKSSGIKGEDEFRKTKRADKQSAMLADPTAEARGDVAFDRKTKKKIITNQGRERINDEINLEFNAALKLTTEKLTKEKYEHLQKETKENVSIGDRIISKSTSGSYDIRNIAPDIKKVSGWNKLAVGLLAGIALSLRNGLKATNLNPGKGTGDFMGDLGVILTNVIKGMNVKVDTGGGHKDDHGGGDHGHGGGGGGHH